MIKTISKLKLYKNSCIQCGKVLYRYKRMRSPLCRDCRSYFKIEDRRIYEHHQTKTSQFT